MPSERNVSSRISGFYKQPIHKRVSLLQTHAQLDDESIAILSQPCTLGEDTADAMSENVVGIHGLPLSVATNFLINGHDYLIPMAVEEPSIVAGASKAARMVRESGGFFGEADASVMTTQVQFDDVPDVDAAERTVRDAKDQLMAQANELLPRLVARGGGCRDIEVNMLDRPTGCLVVNLFVDVGDAMGANIVDQLAESMAPSIHTLIGGRLGLRILSNLPLRRRVRVRALVTAQSLAEGTNGDHVCDAIVRASQFASRDPLRAVTHNKGFMNGVDAAAVALGQDWRSIEAGAHAFAAISGTYRPVSTWTRTPDGIIGQAEIPLAVGIVGGVTQAHSGIRFALKVVNVQSARELAIVLASVGLASNLAALRALSTEGIQRGHMALHHRKKQPMK